MLKTLNSDFLDWEDTLSKLRPSMILMLTYLVQLLLQLVDILVNQREKIDQSDSFSPH